MKKTDIMAVALLLIPTMLPCAAPAAETGRGLTAQELLSQIGIEDGRITPTGFQVLQVREPSTAATAGLKNSDLIGIINDQPVSYPPTKLVTEFAAKVCGVTIISGGAAREIGWPPVDENALPETQLNQIGFYEALGLKRLAERNYQDATANLTRALSVTIHYPYRTDIYLELFRIYADRGRFYARQADTELDLATPPTADTVERVRKLIDQGESDLQSLEDCCDTAFQCLKKARIESRRAGAKLRDQATPDNLAQFDKQLDELSAACDRNRNALAEARDAVDRADFTRWVQCSTRGWWKTEQESVLRETREQRIPIPGTDREHDSDVIVKTIDVYRPMADVTVRNNSTDQPFNGIVSVQFVDQDGRVRGEARIPISLPPGERKTYATRCRTIFQHADVFTVAPRKVGRVSPTYERAAWSVTVYISNRLFGTVPLQ